jgi:hypothetical protein
MKVWLGDMCQMSKAELINKISRLLFILNIGLEKIDGVAFDY